MSSTLDLSLAWQTFPTLTTKRLHLRALTVADVPDHFALFSHPKIAEAHGVAPYENLGQSEQFINWYQEAFKGHEAIRWGIVWRGETAVIGTCGFHELSKRHFRSEIGYELHPDYWRQGIATEAIKAIIIFGFETMALHRIEANVDPNNQASAKLLRKIGFIEEGYLRERFFDNSRFVDDWYFSLLSHEFSKTG